jgi:hypothetical protein
MQEYFGEIHFEKSRARRGSHFGGPLKMSRRSCPARWVYNTGALTGTPNFDFRA